MTLQSVKGLWTGIQRGLYKNGNLNLDPKCMANTIPDDIEYLTTFFDEQDQTDFNAIVKFVTTAGSLVNNNLNFCGATDFYSYVSNFCSTNACDPTTLIQNATGKLF